ncbi:MAG: S8 family peptidase [Methylococcaceae bacterium]
MLRHMRVSRSQTKTGLLRSLISGSALALAMTCPFAQADGAFPSGPPSLTRALGDPRIVLMLQKDVGQEALNPIDPDVLKRLSLKVGIDLAWEANTRTNGQVLSLPFAVTVEQARQAAKALSLESGVLWADVEAGETQLKPKSAIAKNKNQDRTDEISRFIVKLRGDNLSSDLDSGLLTKLATAAGVKLKATDRTAFARILSLEEPITLQQAEAIQISLERLSEVVYADPESHVSIQNVSSITPNDPYFWKDWHLLGPFANVTPPEAVSPYGFNGYLGAANVQAAWELNKGSASTGVAVVDSGILFDHPDLKRSLGRQKTKRGWDMVTSIALARDGNARDLNAQDEGDWVDAFTGCGNALSNSNWHGSHVAGIIAATTNNREGVSGINWRAKIVPVRVLGACPGNLSDIADGIIWAAGSKEVPGTRPNPTPVKVINLSIGGSGACPNAYQEAIDYALSKGISVVVSAGNDSKDVSLANPANCRGVISVASVNHLGDIAFYSNFGSSITVAAPGGQMSFLALFVDPVSGKSEPIPLQAPQWGVWSTINSSLTSPDLGKMAYGPMEGTSMSAPVVSGVVSLMVSADKKHKLTPALVKKILQDTANNFFTLTPTLTVISGSLPPVFNWNNLVPSRCTTSLLGQCGAGIVDAKAAVKAVLELQ